MNKYISVAVFLSLCFAAGAQTFNPTVVVTNTYEGKTMEAHKKDLPMTVPDSLTHFDLTFDYSVFDHPYKGAYEFVPYAMDIRPQAMPDPNKKLFINAGAGFKMHPELDVVFSPRLKKNFQFGVYDNLRGYWGPYVGTSFDFNSDGTGYNMVRGEAFTGYDFRNQFGVDLMYDNSRTEAFLKADLRTITASDNIEKRLFNGADFRAGVASITKSRLNYNAGLDVTFGWDQIHNADKYYMMTELDIKLSGAAHYELFNSLFAGGEIGFDYVSTDNILNCGAMELFAVPQFIWDFDRAYLKLGLRGAYLFSFDTTNRAEADAAVRNFTHPSGYLFPDVEYRYRLVGRNLEAFIVADGGNDLGKYSSLVESNHFLKPTYMMLNRPLMDNSIKKFDGRGGLRFGSPHFQAEVMGGYAVYDNGRLDFFYVDQFPKDARVYNGFSYVDYDQKYIKGSLRWESARVEASFNTKLSKSKVLGEDDFFGVLPARFTADGAVTFNLNHRLFAGITADYSSAREAHFATWSLPGVPRSVTIPDYIDLGVNARFDFSDSFCVWARACNLLNANIQRNIGRAYDGIYFTGGICLNF